MRYQRKSSIAYLFRNFWHLAPVGIVAAVLLGFSDNGYAEMKLWYDYMAGNINAENVLDRIMQAVTVLRYGNLWWVLLIGMVAFILAESILVIKVSRHMRTGEMITFPLRRSIGVLPTMSLFVLCLVVFSECLNLMVVGVAFLLSSTGVLLLLILTCILSFAVRCLALFIIGTLMFAFPIMYVENYSFNSALSYSVRISGEKRGLLWLIALLYPLTRAALIAICAVVQIPLVTVAVFSLFYLFSLLILPCEAFKLFFDSIGGERRDISRVMFG